MIGHVIETLRQLDFIRRVHVSTEDPEIAEIAESFGAACLDPRAADLAGDGPNFADLIRCDLPRYAQANGNDPEVLFVLATAALVPASVYRQAYDVYRKRRPEVLMSCAPFAKSPYRALVENDAGSLRPLFPDRIQLNSQDLPTAFSDAGQFYLFNLDVVAVYPALTLADRLMPFPVPPELSCDVDLPEDWEMLERKFARLQNAKLESRLQ